MALNLISFPSRGEAKLFNLNFCTSLFKSRFDLLCFSLGYFLFQSCVWSLVNEVLSLLKSEAEEILHSLDDAELGCAGLLEDNIELCLLSRSCLSCCCRACYSYSCSCWLDTVLFLENFSKFLNVFYRKVNQLFCKCFYICHNK